MSKVKLRLEIAEEHGLECYICGKELGEVTVKAIESGLIDTDRLVAKAEGGEYMIDTTRLAHPECHMKRHDNWIERSSSLGTLKIIIDDREQFMKMFYKINNQLLAYERRTDDKSEITEQTLKDMLVPLKEELDGRTKMIEKWVKNNAEDFPFIQSAIGVLGLGHMTIGYMMTYLVPERAQYASSYWKYCGFDKPSHERYTKGETSGGNKRLRTALWRGIDSMWKNRDCPYRTVGDRVKDRLSVSEKITRSRNTKGEFVSIPWKDTKPCHRHGAAYRAMMKHLLADAWYVMRKVEGLPTPELYVIDKMGHEGIIKPEERGWIKVW